MASLSGSSENWKGAVTELIWKGKYDERGRRRPVERTVLPLEVVETVTESRVDREKSQGDLFAKETPPDEWRNMLVWGDNKLVMASLLPRFAGKINLIYIDPPFATGRDFSFDVRIGDEESPNQSFLVEEKAYRDTWGGGLDYYLQMMHERLVLMRELLAENGSIYVHLGSGVAHYVKAMMDEVFGEECYRNEIIWRRDVAGKGAKRVSSQWPRNADQILYYSKSPERWFFRQEYGELSETQKRVYRHREPDGRRFKTVQLGDYSEESIRRMEREGLIYVSSSGKKYKKYYLDEARDTVDCIWADIPGFGTRTASAERLPFPTQKPEALLERIVKASSREGELVADFFCGSGTTGAVAEKLGRRWIMGDVSKWAIHVTRKRLLEIEGMRPFEIVRLRDYERHKLAAKGLRTDRECVEFVLQLYGAEPLTGFKTLHGRKGNALVHVGGPDSQIGAHEMREMLEEAKEAGVSEVHLLEWEFEVGVPESVWKLAEEYGVKLHLVCIPKEALEVTDPGKEQVRFFDLNRVELVHEVNGRDVTVAIRNFCPGNPEYLPEPMRAESHKFTDYIDYWAVDWDFRGSVFCNSWQSFRTRKNRKLATKATHTYEAPGIYKILVKLVDIFANEGSELLEANLR